MQYIKIALLYNIKTRVLALGGQSKSSFCFAKGNSAYLSDSGGDLSDLGNFEEFERGIKGLQKKLKIKPGIIACDLHPGYLSTKYAYDLVKSETPNHSLRSGTGHESEVRKIQHHEAHVASCAADNNIKGRVIGIAFDGTGFGWDGKIWGGEFFIGTAKGFKRAAHLKYVPMPGGEASIKEPWRMAFSYLYAIYGKERSLRRLRHLAMTGRKRPMNDSLKLLIQALNKGINSPLTSSMGRLFDAVSSLIGICDFARYEGEAAIKLEKIIRGERRKVKGGKGYAFSYDEKREIIIIDWGPVIKGIVQDLKNKMSRPEISLKFHNAVCYMIKDVCGLLRKKYGIRKVCMSGGVFQNKYLIGRVRPILEKEGFDVYAHKNIPTHDGGIALGQAVLAGV